MFSYSDDFLTRLVISGKLNNGKEIIIPMQRWFKFPVGFQTSRYNEISRQNQSIKGLADYVCNRFNQEIQQGMKLESLSISSVAWGKQKGERKKLNEVLAQDLQYYNHLRGYNCPNR